MALDAVAVRALTIELEQKLVGGRIDKALQPERDEVQLLIRNNYENYRLLISASALHARVHLSAQAKPNPQKAPIFCMLLRKHIVGGRILDIRQANFDRIMEMDITSFDELGEPTYLTLRMETMGRHSNIILTGSDGRIIDSIKRINEDRSRVREILPGLRYEYPPMGDKLSPEGVDAAALHGVFAAPGDEGLSKRLFGAVTGLSPQTAAEFISNAGFSPEQPATGLDERARQSLVDALLARFELVLRGEFSPCVLGNPAAPDDFYPLAREGWQSVESMSCAMDAYYFARDHKERMRQRCASMTQVMQSALSRAQRKLQKQSADLDSAEGLETFRVQGELVTANIHRIHKGLPSIAVENYYTGAEMEIPLDIRLTPAQNAQRYYKKYTKARATLEKLKDHYRQTRLEIAYIEGQLLNIGQCTNEAEAVEIQEELMNQGYIRRPKAAKRQAKAVESSPLSYRSSDGFTILVGRNNAQNDRLTLRTARADDIWLHTKDIPGSHVIILTEGRAPSDTAVREAALLAAYYSKARSSANVPVDYTPRRHVRKPSGSRPGYVIYFTNQTIYVTPDESSLAAIEATPG